MTTLLAWARLVPNPVRLRCGLTIAGKPKRAAARWASSAVSHRLLGGASSPAAAAISSSSPFSRQCSRTSWDGRPCRHSPSTRSRWAKTASAAASVAQRSASCGCFRSSRSRAATKAASSRRGSGSRTRRRTARDQAPGEGRTLTPAVTSNPAAARPRQAARAERSSESVTRTRRAAI